MTTKDWETRVLSNDDIHVMPNNDLKPHTATRDCWCNPEIDKETINLPVKVIIHNSTDGRELKVN